MGMTILVLMTLVGLMVVAAYVQEKKKMKKMPYRTRNFLRNLGAQQEEHQISEDIQLRFKMRYATHVEVWCGTQQERSYHFLGEVYELNDTPNKVLEFHTLEEDVKTQVDSYLQKRYEMMNQNIKAQGDFQ